MIRSDTYLTLDRDGSRFSIGIGSHKARTRPTPSSSHYTWHKAFSTALTIIAAKHCRVRRVVIYLEEKEDGSTT